MRRLLALALASAVLAPASGCAADGSTRLALSAKNLPALPQKLGHYALWARTDKRDLMAGTFTVDAQGKPMSFDQEEARFEVPVGAGGIRELFVTQELPDSNHEKPSKQVFLRGRLNGEASTLEAPIKPADFADAGGCFLLDNAVTYKDPLDYNGVWFAEIRSRRYEPGLKLPKAPPGWLYAGWVMLDGVPLRMGKFRSPRDADDWDAYSGRSGATELINPAGQPMPGEDFIRDLPPGVPQGPNKPNLSGAQVFVTLENATLANEEIAPSPVRILEGQVPVPAAQKVRYELHNVTDRLPGADVKIVAG